MAFVFQQPGSAKLLEAIGNAAKGADSILAVFAFASASGVQAFFGVPEIAAMLAKKGSLHLIVGTDAITNAAALLAIADVKKRYGAAITAEAFFHEQAASTFHPKFVQFRKAHKLCLITGSGNLTARGLGIVSAMSPAPGNWEAFGEQTISGAEAVAVTDYVDTWLSSQKANKTLLPLTDERVKSRAMSNGLIRFATKPKPPAGSKVPLVVPAAPDEELFDANDILVSELPKNRPGQADVGKEALSDFFGYAGKTMDVLLQHVALNNQLGKTESIRLFVNESKNYRLELHAMSGIPYQIAPDDSRMILVATKLDKRSFRYTIVPVHSPEFKHLELLLGPMHKGRRYMRKKRVNPVELKLAWSTAPLNLIPVLSDTPPP